MPSKKDIERKADSLISRLFPETLKESDYESMNENDTVDDDFATGLAKAIEKSKSEKTFDCKLSGIGKEMVLFESSGTRSKNLEKLLNALLTICPTSVSSERAFSVSGSIVVRRRAGLKDETINDLCFLNGFFTKEK